MSYLLDTSVFSQPLKNRKNEKVIERWDQIDDASILISIITEAEILWGLARSGAARKIVFYRDHLRPRAEVLLVDHSVAESYAKIRARQEEIGQQVAEFDLLIAATARVHNLTVATLNRSDFCRIEGIRWEDWSV